MQIDAILQQLGFFSGYTAVLWLITRTPVTRWIERRVDAGVEEGLRKRLAAHQLDLDKDLERHRSTLAQDADRLRSNLERGTIDYSLYATKRHEAQARLFEEFLRAELLATDHSEVLAPDPQTSPEETISSWLQRLEQNPERVTNCLALFRAQEWMRLTTEMDALAADARRSRVVRARHDAYEAYFRHALYLAPSVDLAAIAVRDQFHVVAGPYVLSSGSSSGAEMFANKTRLRFLMLEYLNAARRDLGRAAVDLDPTPKSAGQTV